MSYTNSFGSAPRTPAVRRVRARRPPRRRPLFAPRTFSAAHVVVAAVLVCALGTLAWCTASALGALSAGAQEAGGSEAPLSTPRDEWRAGEVPSLYQGDPAWASVRYAGADFGESGCGPTCLSMVYIALTGRDDRSPADMAALSEQMGCATPDGTAWAFMTEGAASCGLIAREVPADEESVRRAIAGGSPVICSMGPGDFTSTGHFIVLCGIDRNGRLMVRDPNSPKRSAQTWDFDVVLGQARAIWAYDAA